jgi:hypothetical protein
MHSVVTGVPKKRQTYLYLMIRFSTGFFHMQHLELSPETLWETCE